MDQIIDRLHELLKKDLPKDAIKEYYIGMPDNMSEMLMPFIATEFVTLSSRLGPTGMDADQYTIEMFLYFPKKQGIGNQHAKGERAMYRRMLELVNKLDFSGSYATRSTSIMSILRNHIFFAGSTLNTSSTEITINNDIDVLVGPSDDDNTYFFVKFTLKVSQLIQIANRL